MQFQNKPYGLLSVFAFILAGGTYAYVYVKVSGATAIGNFNNIAGYLMIFFVVVGCMLAALSFFAKKK